MSVKKSLSLAMVAALLLAACGSDGDDGVEPAAPETTVTTEEMTETSEMTDDEMSDDEMSDDEMSDDEMSDDEMSDDEMTDEEMSDDEMEDMGHPTTFTVRIENVSESFTDGEGYVTPLAPGVWVLDAEGNPLFELDMPDAGLGLEALAEDGAADELAASIAGSEVFAIPASGDEPGPALPGDAYEFEFVAEPGERLNFATMFVQSNDWFFAPTEGIELFDEEYHAIEGDVTSQVSLLDAGTEVDQPLSVGVDQPPRQSAANTGDADSLDTVREVMADVGSLILVTITPQM